jgi:hypothetical protein
VTGLGAWGGHRVSRSVTVGRRRCVRLWCFCGSRWEGRAPGQAIGSRRHNGVRCVTAPTADFWHRSDSAVYSEEEDGMVARQQRGV